MKVELSAKELEQAVREYIERRSTNVTCFSVEVSEFQLYDNDYSAVEDPIASIDVFIEQRG